MFNSVYIGNTAECKAQVHIEGYANTVLARVDYEQGVWVLHNLGIKPIQVNKKTASEPIILNKYDKIKIGNRTLYWSDYLFEGDRQKLTRRDLTTIYGRISRSNYRALIILCIGIGIAIFFAPGLIVSSHRRRTRSHEITEEMVRSIAPEIYALGYSLLGLFILLISIKRLRDTGNSPWLILVPFVNIKHLFFTYSDK